MHAEVYNRGIMDLGWSPTLHSQLLDSFSLRDNAWIYREPCSGTIGESIAHYWAVQLAWYDQGKLTLLFLFTLPALGPPESGYFISVFGHDSTSKIWIWIDKILRLPYEYSPPTPCLFHLHTSSLLMASILFTWLPKLSTSSLYLSFSFTIHIPGSVHLMSRDGHCYSPGSGSWSALPSSLSCTLIFPV